MKTSELIRLRPSMLHNWNPATRTWDLSRDVAIKEIKINLDKERKRRLISPILYTDKLIDADDVAQNNISGKLQEIEIRESIGISLNTPELFWKDADNIVHTWVDQAAYKLWLQGLVVAISSRNTALYTKSWAKKAEVLALTDVNDIINYDVTTGWD